MQADFERELAARIRTRRLIFSCLALTFFALLILCVALRESTKEIIVHNFGYSIIPPWTEVNYNDGYIFPIVLTLMGTVFTGFLLIVDFLMCGYRTVHKDLHCITLYRGIHNSIVYIDGTEKGRLSPLSHTHVVEAWMSNGVRVTVSFSRALWYMAHVSFSDDTASREV